MRVPVAVLIGSLLAPCLVGEALAAEALAADEAAPAASTVAQGVQAKPLRRVQPVYPDKLRRRGYEGFVLVSFVVKADGSTADPIIEDSSGALFEEATLAAVRQWQYEPATFGGAPVDQAYTNVSVVFSQQAPKEPTRRFLRAYSEVGKQLQAGDLSGTAARLAELEQAEQVTMREHAYLALLDAELRVKQGDKVAQLRSLTRATVDNGSALERRAYAVALRSIYALEVDQQALKSALATLETLGALKGETPEPFAQTASRIREQAAGAKRLARPGRIGTPEEIAAGRAPRRWSHALLRSELGFQDVVGTLDSVEFRCSWHRVLDTSVPAGRTWKIPASWGDCRVYVTGAAGTTFTLVELPAEPTPEG